MKTATRTRDDEIQEKRRKLPILVYQLECYDYDPAKTKRKLELQIDVKPVKFLTIEKVLARL